MLVLEILNLFSGLRKLLLYWTLVVLSTWGQRQVKGTYSVRFQSLSELSFYGIDLSQEIPELSLCLLLFSLGIVQFRLQGAHVLVVL